MTKQDLLKKIEGKTGLIDFWAPWCGPCMMISPMIDELVKEVGVELVKVNVDEENSLANEFGISSIPSIMTFCNGVIMEEMVGSRTKDSYKKALEKCL